MNLVAKETLEGWDQERYALFYDRLFASISTKSIMTESQPLSRTPRADIGTESKRF